MRSHCFPEAPCKQAVCLVIEYNFSRSHETVLQDYRYIFEAASVFASLSAEILCRSFTNVLSS